MIPAVVLAAAQTMTFTADRIVADNVTRSLVATGHVVATYKPLTLRSESLSRGPDGKMLFCDPSYATTCSNDVGHTHWNVTGEVEYKANDYVILRNAWLTFCEYPILWLPYLYYPLDTGDSGFSWMPGYSQRWGAFLLTKTRYHILGDATHAPESRWLEGDTRFDLRTEQGIAFGEDLKWSLGDFGKGALTSYYAYDQNPDGHHSSWHDHNWGSEIEKDRYAVGLVHRWEPTERDRVLLRGSVYSDSYFRDDFERRSFFNWKGESIGYQNSGFFWEHLENDFAVGVEASGRLNDFYEMTGRLPEIYFDVNPQPLFGLPVNYETGNRVGWLTRDPAEYGSGNKLNPFAYNPAVWAEYDAVRVDTYHRLTAPFKTLDDLLSVVPRLGYRGTFWSESGADNLTGWGDATEEGELFRSILEGGVTFAGRGTAWIDESWRHMVEPYFDVLAQEAWFSGPGDRPYVFDNLDASVMWEDQFAGRARNLPYSYYGVTPGLRNVWDKLDEHGDLRPVVDLDVYAAFQFGETSYHGADETHWLAKRGKPNYGRHGVYATPGARVRWTPAKDLSVLARAEYDPDYETLATADFGLQHKVSGTFKYDVTYALRDYRCWDFASVPYDSALMTSDDMNYVKAHYVRVGGNHQPLDWLAWGPYVRWDLREEELDCIGTWVDFLTDCLGFRFLVEYENEYTRIDGYKRDEDWSFGFYIYLRAFGADRSNLFR